MCQMMLPVEYVFVRIIGAFGNQPTQPTLKLPTNNLDRLGLIHYFKPEKTAFTTKVAAFYFLLCNSKYI